MILQRLLNYGSTFMIGLIVTKILLAIGIIGVGRIGSRIAKRMQAMEMKTIGYDPYIPEERFKQLGVEQVDLDTLLKRSDYITMHTPLTKETRASSARKKSPR